MGEMTPNGAFLHASLVGVSNGEMIGSGTIFDFFAVQQALRKYIPKSRPIGTLHAISPVLSPLWRCS
jgi:hypothetical protein